MSSSHPKAFVIAHLKEVDSGGSGFTLYFTTNPKEQATHERSKATVLLYDPVSPTKEKELRQAIKAIGLKTGKWFTEKDVGITAKKVKGKLGYSLLAKIFG